MRTDDPRLTVREIETPRQPLRVIVDSRLETPSTARILEGETPTDPARFAKAMVGMMLQGVSGE